MTAIRKSPAPPAAAPKSRTVHYLEPGDHLTLAEFERRYDADPLLKKAELIDGIVYMPSPVRFTDHAEPHLAIAGWLDRYLEHTPGLRGGDNASLRLDMRSMPQPDAFLFIRSENGGRVRLDDKGYVVGAPELVAEVAASSASYDLHEKFEAYRRNGVGEYLVWRVEDNVIDWFHLDGSVYLPIASTDGVLRSVLFPGLWLDAPALLALDRARVAQVLALGIASGEHAAFVQKLKEQKVSS